ncbi:hypothetical protein OROGR_031431 [Orobanche gracilis]
MNYMVADEECMSECESGWTLYLEHSSISPYTSYNQENEFHDHGRKNEAANRLDEEEEEENGGDSYEDLSMVSDASSGPPHLHEDDGYGVDEKDGCFYQFPVNNDDDSVCENSKKKNREKRRRNVQDHSSSLDDTASSSFFDFSNEKLTLTRRQPSMENALEYSQGYSSTQLDVRPPYEEQYDFFQSAQPGNQLQQNHQVGLKAKGGDVVKNNNHQIPCQK